MTMTEITPIEAAYRLLQDPISVVRCMAEVVAQERMQDLIFQVDTLKRALATEIQAKHSWQARCLDAEKLVLGRYPPTVATPEAAVAPVALTEEDFRREATK